MDKLDRLYQHATDLRLDVVHAELPLRIHGFYEDASRLIVLNSLCTAAQMIGALAHEVGHGHYGDRCSTEAIERRADEKGASLVIGPREYAEAEEAVGEHAGALARHMGVTRDMVVAWRRWWVRQGRMAA